jgi:hypothetical protein
MKDAGTRQETGRRQDIDTNHVSKNKIGNIFDIKHICT